MSNDAPREGFVKTPLWIYDLNAVLSGARWKIVGVIARETYGWGRADAPLTAQDIADAAGLARPVVSAELTELARIGLIRRTQSGRSYLLGLNPLSPSAIATALNLSENMTRPALNLSENMTRPDSTCQKNLQVIVRKYDRLLSENMTRPIEEDRSGKIGIDPPPPTPAAGGGGGGDKTPSAPGHTRPAHASHPRPSGNAGSEPTTPPDLHTPATPGPRETLAAGGTHAESVRILTQAHAKSAASIHAAARLHPDRVRQILAEDRDAGRGIGSTLRRCQAEADMPEIAALIAQGGAATAPEPPPSDAAIWDLPLPPRERQTWLARFRRAETASDQREVLARLQREYPRESA